MLSHPSGKSDRSASTYADPGIVQCPRNFTRAIIGGKGGLLDHAAFQVYLVVMKAALQVEHVGLGLLVQPVVEKALGDGIEILKRASDKHREAGRVRRRNGGRSNAASRELDKEGDELRDNAQVRQGTSRAGKRKRTELIDQAALRRVVLSYRDLGRYLGRACRSTRAKRDETVLAVLQRLTVQLDFEKWRMPGDDTDCAHHLVLFERIEDLGDGKVVVIVSQEAMALHRGKGARYDPLPVKMPRDDAACRLLQIVAGLAGRDTYNKFGPIKLANLAARLGIDHLKGKRLRTRMRNALSRANQCHAAVGLAEIEIDGFGHRCQPSDKVTVIRRERNPSRLPAVEAPTRRVPLREPEPAQANTDHGRYLRPTASAEPPLPADDKPALNPMIRVIQARVLKQRTDLKREDLPDPYQYGDYLDYDTACNTLVNDEPVHGIPDIGTLPARLNGNPHPVRRVPIKRGVPDIATLPEKLNGAHH